MTTENENTIKQICRFLISAQCKTNGKREKSKPEKPEATVMGNGVFCKAEDNRRVELLLKLTFTFSSSPVRINKHHRVVAGVLLMMLLLTHFQI